MVARPALRRHRTVCSSRVGVWPLVRMAAHFRWANGNTAATFRSQAGTDMELVMNSDNWLVKVCPDGTFTARGQQRLVESRAIAAACWFMVRVQDDAHEMLFSEIVFEPTFERRHTPL